jgi:hypothetical protein
MNYTHILKQAYHNTLRSKAMWFLGIFIISGGGFSIGNFGGMFDNGDESSEFSSAMDSFGLWLEQYWWILLLLGLGVLLLCLISMVLNYVAYGAMFYGAHRLLQHHQPKFWEMVKVGFNYLPRIFAANFLVGAAIGLGVIALAIPIILLGITVIGLIVAIPLAIVAILLLIPVGAASTIMLMYAMQGIVLKQHRTIESLKYAWKLMLNHLGDSTVMYLFLMLINLAVWLAVFVLTLVLAIPFVVVGYLAYMAASWAGALMVGGIGLIILGVLLLFTKGIRQAYVINTWHGVFADLQ